MLLQKYSVNYGEKIPPQTPEHLNPQTSETPCPTSHLSQVTPSPQTPEPSRTKMRASNAQAHGSQFTPVWLGGPWAWVGSRVRLGSGVAHAQGARRRLMKVTGRLTSVVKVEHRRGILVLINSEYLFWAGINLFGSMKFYIPCRIPPCKHLTRISE